MKKTPVCVLMIALAIVGGGQTALAGSEPQDERDFAVDHAIGGLKKGSRMLAPEGHSTATSHSRSTKPGGAISPKDAGGLTSGSRGAGAATSGGGGTQTGGAQGGGSTGGGTGASATEAPRGGGGTGTEAGTGSESLGGGGTGTGITEEPSGGGTEPSATTDTGASNDLIELDVDVDTSTGAGSADLSVGGETVVETEASTGTDLSGTTEPVTEEISTTLDAGVVTDTTTIDASTETTEGSLTVDVSAGSDTLGDALLGTGSELDPDATTAEETTDILDDCSALDPLSLPEHCL